MVTVTAETCSIWKTLKNCSLPTKVGPHCISIRFATYPDFNPTCVCDPVLPRPLPGSSAFRRRGSNDSNADSASLYSTSSAFSSRRHSHYDNSEEGKGAPPLSDPPILFGESDDLLGAESEIIADQELRPQGEDGLEILETAQSPSSDLLRVSRSNGQVLVRILRLALGLMIESLVLL
jgi:hypothetical protein